MKILLATGIYPPDPGGPAQYTRGLAYSLNADEHKATVVTYAQCEGKHGDGYLGRAWDVFTIKREQNILFRYFKFYKCIKNLAEDFDLIVLQGPVSEGLPGALAAIRLKKPYIIKIVGDYAWEQYRLNEGNSELLDDFLSHKHSGKIWLLEKLERWTTGKSKKVVVPSEYLANVVKKWGVNTEYINVIYNAARSFGLVQDRFALRRQFKIDNQQRLLFAAARSVPWKNIDFVIKLLPKLPQDIYFVVAGDGPSRESWEQLVKELNLSDRVRFVGVLEREEVAEWMVASDLFILPSGYEGFPHVIPEAASVGLPSLVSDKGGNPETRKLLGTNLVTVLPYLDEEAWVNKLSEKWPERQVSQLPDELKYETMLEKTLGVYKEAL